MQKETYKRAIQLQEQIAQLEADITTVKEQLNSKNLLIRFGGHFNVSAPIQLRKEYLIEICNSIIEAKSSELKLLKQLFNDL